MESTTETYPAAAASSSSMSVFLMLVGCVATLWYVYFRMSRRRLYECAATLPGPEGLPIIGSALELMGGPEVIFKSIYGKSFEYDGGVVKMWVGPRLLVFLFDPRDVELILGSSVHLDKSTEYRFFKPWLGNGLLISSGDKWRSHRKLIAPTFHLNVLKSFLELFNANSRSVVDKMRKHGANTFDVHDHMSECTVEILLETAMGVNKKTQDKSGFEYAKAVMDMCDILHLRHTHVWLRPDIIFHLTKYGKTQEKLLDVIHSLTKKVLKKKKEDYNKNKAAGLPPPSAAYNTPPTAPAEVPATPKAAAAPKAKAPEAAGPKESFSFGHSVGLKDDLDVDDNDIGEKKRLAFLDFMIESSQNGVVLTDEEIKEEVDTIMFEGHDTTAAGSSFFLCMMAARPDIQERVIEEIDQVFGNSDRPCSFQDTLELKYLERCIMETLRMYPPVPIIARELKQELKLESINATVPANCTVIVGTYKLHRREDIFPNPNHFDPDNFLPERAASRHYYSFVPFSAGPRSCVGRKYAMLKLKVILSTVLRNFRVMPGIPEKDWVLQADIILKRTDGFRIKLQPRKPAASAK
ncbi:LOW QUALITY PROTEIN: cytochrome P450 4g15-like [Nilaparvata lugens]|uniref:LOW QUALITY PROTEIN: cytochrome P450 4g15-like n=1 Tax=Nilaparvata lugens TaxID=108931 RepID=UPI00193D8EA7|nr:LOW QUALITY PROTEIN: cytochrome P450 4g15-like [Nilaparvata lugens]